MYAAVALTNRDHGRADPHCRQLSVVYLGHDGAMRASRMMTLLLHLQVRGRASGSELARLLEVSERTVQRDVEALVASGVPVRSTRGPAGGYRLGGGYRTRLTGVGLDEAGALAFLGLAGPAQQLGLGEILEGARIKVWASLTGEARQRARHTAER